MEGRPPYVFVDLWAAFLFVGNQVTQRAEPIIISINQSSMLQKPAAASQFPARMHPASLVKPSKESRVRKQQTADH